MMKWIYISIIFFTLSCSNSKKTQESKSKSTKSELFTEAKLSLSFERTLCFGMCPAYKIQVMNDGSCTYEGYKFTDMIGKYEATLSKEQYDRIKSEADRINFWELESKYDAPVTDLPSVIIMLAGPNGPKEIVDRTDAPEELKDFEKITDGILLSLDWTKIEE